MGQQQLLLVILVTIIVGVATVVAINIFGQSAENANVDAARQDVLTLSAMSQAWYIKPELMDGGAGSFDNIDVDALGFGYSEYTDGQNFANENAEFTLAGNGDQLTITAEPLQSERTITATVSPNEITDLTVAEAAE